MEFSSLQHILLLSVLSFCFHYFYLLLFSKPKQTKHGFKIYPLLGALPDFLKNRHRFLEWTTETLRQCPTNSSFFCRPATFRGIFTANPMIVEHMLKTNFENYPKGQLFVSYFQDLFGHGLFNTDGELWSVQRRTASYEFNTKSLRNFATDTVKVELSSRLIPALATAAEMETTVDLQDMLERFAFDNICKLAFNVDPGCLGSDQLRGRAFMAAFEEATALSCARLVYVLPILWKLKKFFNIGSEKSLRRSIRIVHEFADDIIKQRMEQKTNQKDEDLLSRFMGNGDCPQEYLRDIITSFILAGRDTTSSALSWFFWQLSLNPTVEKTILKEILSIRARSKKKMGEIYTLEELKDMHYLHAAISESLRLYPPAPVNRRVSKSDDILPDGTRIGKGWFIIYNAYAMGRMESIWGKNCREFQPERWLENGICKQESPFKFPVFHAGPRMCLGKDMAYIQMKSIAASIIERFEIDAQNKEKCPEHLLSLTLRMKGGLQIKVKERSADTRASVSQA